MLNYLMLNELLEIITNFNLNDEQKKELFFKLVENESKKILTNIFNQLKIDLKELNERNKRKNN